MKKVRVSVGDREYGLSELRVPLRLEELLPGSGGWEVELGFGKGRYLLQRAQQTPGHRFLGIEVASAYYRLVRRRCRRRELQNLMLVRGEALFLLAAALPDGFAEQLHLYFPDPWPKARHQKRRLMDAETVDLVLGLLRPGGRLYFATDHPAYGAAVEEILQTHPCTEVRQRPGGWDDGARTNYESKYERTGRPILRLEVTWCPERVEVPFHPEGVSGIVVAFQPTSAA